LAAVYAEMGFYSKVVSAFEEDVRLNPDDRGAQLLNEGFSERMNISIL
jgi:hypothetical protein